MIYINKDGGIVGIISHAELSQLPGKLARQIMEQADTSRETEDGLEFFFRSEAIADRIYQAITYCQKQNLDTSQSLRRPPEFQAVAEPESSPARKTLDKPSVADEMDERYSETPGLYLDEDVEQLFDIQKSRCYYTGKPLVRDPGNYTIDLIEPISEGGTFWPGNLALVLKSVADEKGNDTKMKYFMQLKKEQGEGWYQKQRAFCKEVDMSRRNLDRHRKDAVADSMISMEARLRSGFPGHHITYALDSWEPRLKIDSVSVVFSAGFVRRRQQFDSFSYLSGLVRALTASTGQD